MFMDVARKCSPPPWGDDQALSRVFAVLNDGVGPENEPLTLIVGGAVRNALLGLPIVDYDLATRLTPDQVMARARSADLGVVPTGLTHGTVTLVADGRGFEVTTLRKDMSTDGRHAVVEYTQDWGEDARRRDFTMNTLLADLNGHIYDPLGAGVADALARVVRFVGDPETRIREDYLRILRYYRFRALYGGGAVDPAAADVCAALAPQIAQLSRERITAEVKKWLAAENLADTIKESRKNNILYEIFHSDCDVESLLHLVTLQQATGRGDVLARLLVLVRMTPEVLTSSMSLSNNEINQLEFISYVDSEELKRGNWHRQAYLYGACAVFQRLLIDHAQAGTTPDLAVAVGICDMNMPSFPLRGADLLAVGIPAGPEVGMRLKEAEAIWLESDFKLSRADLLSIVTKK